MTPKVPNTVIFPNALFLDFPGIYRCFRTKVLSQTLQNAFFITRGPNPKVLIMRWKKVLTNETLSMHKYIYVGNQSVSR